MKPHEGHARGDRVEKHGRRRHRDALTQPLHVALALSIAAYFVLTSCDRRGRTVAGREDCKPVIERHPESVTVPIGERAQLRVMPRPTDEQLAYEWYEVRTEGSVLVPQSNRSRIRVTPQRDTTYFVRVSNRCGATDSNVVQVRVQP